ncbi:YqaJ viral recombinase family protein [Arthrobacter sp. GMC3]|uniref:YqaJ viral recombinase family protein n=1 Tax=Arthrobacter sp. GMC3 TaxID=2058894 RepID=UPI001CA4C578|nr:YqaJ viral recombinase family protein [Arthrobacter sp. GMC3]
MTLHIYEDLDQGTPEWFAARAGIPTASVMHHLITTGSPDALTIDCPNCGSTAGDPCMSLARKIPAPIKTVHGERSAAASALPPVYRVADNLGSQGLTATLAAERITGHVEPMATSRDMERGTLDEPYARDVYSERYAPATVLGFMVRDFGGYSIGYSPDGMVGDDGLLEIKSRKQKIQLGTFLDDEVPAENMAQLQTGLLVSGRDWIDYMSYAGGMPPYIKRVYPSNAWFDVIHQAAAALEITAADMLDKYLKATDGNEPTERIDHYLELELKL